MLLSLLLAAIVQTQPAFEFDVSHGLHVKVSGIPVVTGSWLQYYEDGWSKAYYSTNNDDTKIQQIDADTVREDYSGYNGVATGTVTYHRDGEHLKVHYDLHWNADKPAEIELTAGMISAQAVQAGTLTADGKPTRDLHPTVYSAPGFDPRKFSPDAKDNLFDSPLANLEVKTSLPATLFDARGFPQDYAEGKSLFWFGELKLDVAKNAPITFDVDWQFHPKPVPPFMAAKVSLTALSSPDVIKPDETPLLIIPTPTTNQLKFNKTLVLAGVYDFPAGHVRFWETEFLGGLRQRFEVPAPDKKAAAIHVDGGVSKLGFHPGGYQITITDSSISIFGEEDEGLHNALRRLARLAFVRSGKLVLPTGYLSANPQIAWRGVHMFVGPDARDFQAKLWDRVLLPMGFNKVVLQCERTQWDCMPNMHGVKNNMTKQGLHDLFADYRAIGVEPIPLIQSFGHMEWFFEGNQNLDVAVNPKVPYTIDPRNPKSKDMIDAIWDEACDLLKPQTVHFGCDEVDMLGFPNDDATLVTDLWKLQMPVLKGIADKYGAQMMLWGDKGLAPGEAIDATNGDTKEEAAKRRAAIPKGSWIADWHYKPEAMVEAFLPSLQLWKKEGFKPIATAWYQPENVRSIDLAADVEKCGTLQTTWSGYFSSEQNFIDNFEQFSAMILAGDYSWSTRYDSVSKVGYDPGEILREMYFGQPRSVVVRPGFQVFQGTALKDLLVRDIQFKIGDPIDLRSILSAPTEPDSVDIAFKGKAQNLAIALDALDKCDDGERIAELTIMFAGGQTKAQQILYGRQVRSAEDRATSPFAIRSGGLSIVTIPLGALKEIVGIRLEAVVPRGGLRVHGIVGW